MTGAGRRGQDEGEETVHDISTYPSIEADAVVVGAGFARTTTARKPKQARLAAAPLEARMRLGGRPLSRPISDGKVVELKCEFHLPGDSVWPPS
jgi:monoamine oxidase